MRKPIEPSDLAGNLKVEPIADTNVIRVAYRLRKILAYLQFIESPETDWICTNRKISTVCP